MQTFLLLEIPPTLVFVCFCFGCLFFPSTAKCYGCSARARAIPGKKRVPGFPERR